MQRKHLWGGAALIVAGAAAAFIGADHVWRHPDSVLSRTAATLTFAGVNANPMSVLNRAVTGTDACQAAPEVAQINVAKPILTGEAEETIEPIQVEAVPQAVIEPPQPGGVEESDWTWPYRFEDESEAPVPMLYAEEPAYPS